MLRRRNVPFQQTYQKSNTSQAHLQVFIFATRFFFIALAALAHHLYLNCRETIISTERGKSRWVKRQLTGQSHNTEKKKKTMSFRIRSNDSASKNRAYQRHPKIIVDRIDQYT